MFKIHFLLSGTCAQGQHLLKIISALLLWKPSPVTLASCAAFLSFLFDFAFHPGYNVTVFRLAAENKLSDDGQQTLWGSKVMLDWQKGTKRDKLGTKEEKE